MAKRRGDDDKQAGPPPAVPPAAEVPADNEGFPVSAPPAPEALGDPTPGNGVGAEPGDAADAPLLKVAFDFHREFRKHTKTGDLVAIELVNGALVGVRRCSKPEEQTAGALPVMQLEPLDSDAGQWYRAENRMFATWEPPLPPRQLLDRLGDLYEQAVAARSKYESAKLAAKHAKERVEEVDEAIFHALRRMHDVGGAQAELPLEPTPVEEQPDPSLPLDAAEETAGDSSIETDPPEPGAVLNELIRDAEESGLYDQDDDYQANNT